MKRNYEKIKRIFDVFTSIILICMLLPFFPFVYISIILAYGKPAIIGQKRAGFLGKPFMMFKFRTMNDLRDKDGKLLPDQYRITTFGQFFRKTSLDELPELWNVIKGEMSLVGPRALLIEYLDRYTPEQARRHEVKPGITGWAQVNGRNVITWEEKFKLDVWYVDNMSFGLDIKILILTVIKVLKMEGISAKGHATMPVFSGSDKY